MPIFDPQWPRADAWLARDDDPAEILVVGVPSSKASLSPSRADLTPGEMRERLTRFSTFHGERGISLDNVKVSDRGNWPVSELDMNEMPGVVERLASELVPATLNIYLGGDNAITRPLVRAAAATVGSIGVITIDAHHDVRSLDNGPTNGTPIRGLIEEDGLPGAHVAQIGIHGFANSGTYRAYCDEVGIKVHDMRAVDDLGAASVMARTLEALAAQCEAIYVDVDMDVLDRSFAPACPGARPGGMTVRQLSDAVFTAAAHRSVSWMDIVEVDAGADPEGVTLDAMAHVMLTAAAGYASRAVPSAS